jgi:hypothetical protein
VNCVADYEGQQTHIYATSLDNSEDDRRPHQILHIKDRCLLRIVAYTIRLLVYKDLDDDVHGRELIVADIWNKGSLPEDMKHEKYRGIDLKDEFWL